MSNFFLQIADAATRFRDRPAIEWIGPHHTETTTYGELIASAAATAADLAHRRSTRAGDRVAILAPNNAHWVATYLGILRLGAVAVPFDTNYNAAQVRTVLADSGARILYTTQKLAAVASAAADGLDVHVELLDAESPRASPSRADARETAVAGTTPNDAAVILYTSGTTADPKGVVLTHANLAAERAGAFAVVTVTERDVVLGVLPLFHALAQMANLLLPLSVGARVIFLETVSSSSLVDALATRGVTVFACVPQFFYLIHERVFAEIDRRGALARRPLRALIAANVRLRDATRLNLGKVVFGRVHRRLGSAIRLLITGGSRFDPAIARDLYGLGFSVLNAYGLTETSGGATIMRLGDRFTASVGQPFPGVEIKIEDPTGATQEDNGDSPSDAGEILIRGDIVMREYFNRADATREVLSDGWLRTGDLGRLDREGRLYIAGRRKEIIVLSSGKNLYPEEIEAHYRRSPFIKELAVLGLTRPDAPASERLHAVVVPDEAAMRARGAVNMRELIRFELEGRSIELPAHKRVLSYDISLTPLARTTTGKLRRKEIEREALRRASEPPSTRAASADEIEWARHEYRADLVSAIAARLNRSTVLPDANLELDLGLDSMERVEMLTMLEERAGRTAVSPDVRATIFTVRQLVDAVIGSVEASGTARASARSGEPWQVLLGQAPDSALIEDLNRRRIVTTAAGYAILRTLRFVARVCLGFRVTGVGAVPRQGAVVITPNHQTFLDGFFVAASLPFSVFRRMFFVGAAEYFERPFMAWAARVMRIVPVDADANLVRAMQAAATGLRTGRVLIVFPEGERTIDGEIKTFRKGAAILAGALNVPIVPAALDGLFPLWPRGRGMAWGRLFALKRPRTSLTFGTPLDVPRGDETRGTATLQRAVNDLLTAARSTTL